ncbi:TPA: hypothetical protein ACK8T7_004377 [Klebsiella aerogenes]
MTKSTITRELVHWLHDAATEFASTKLKMTMKPDEVLALTGALLAAMDSEPVGEVVLGDYDDCGDYPNAKVICTAAQGQADWSNFKNGTKLYSSQPATIEIDERAAFNAWNNEDNLPIAGVGAKNAAWLAWQARAMLQAEPVTTANKLGNSPVIPDGSAAILRRWLAFGCGMKNIGIQLPRNLLAETEVMLAATMQEVNRG